MVTVEVRLFANLREAAASEKILLVFESTPTVGDVIERVLAEFPALKRILLRDGRFNDRYKVLMGQDLVFPENFSMPVQANRIAIMPPVSGG
ncbi:MAG: MoaD/ThiS family protein [Candidatus Methanomethylicus sp.]|nr:MoaD/ThiS family protein [Candidatus Methanomethylicus sp.]